MLRVGDLVKVTVNDSNHNRSGIVVEFLSTGSVLLYIDSRRLVYPTAFLSKVE